MPSSNQFLAASARFLHSPDTGDFTTSIVLLIGFGNGQSSSPRAKDSLGTVLCINALRGHLAEYGHVVPQGPAHVDRLVAVVEDPKSAVPESARGILQVLIR